MSPRREPGAHPGLFTDMYHPDAAYVSWVTGRNGLTTFDLYARTAPFDGGYLLVAGLEAALEFVESFRYVPDELAFLARIRDYDAAFLDELATLRFTGDISAMPEGSIAFPNEPLLRVTAPFREAVLMEAGLLQAINLATLSATKAARIVHAAQRRRVSEFAFRRAQNPLVVARSSYIGGASSTSLLAAAFEYRLLATGTVPHALIQLYPSEEEAFLAVAQSFNRYTLLLDTYDPRAAIHTAIAVAQRMADELGHTLAAVRLDSGDLVADSQYVRARLAEAGMQSVRILASGDLDEFEIVDLLAAEKTTWPGRKAVYRHPRWEEDVVQLESEPAPTGYQRLLRPVMRQGRVIPGSLPPLSEIWELAQANLRALPEAYHALKVSDPYPVRFSEALRSLRLEAIREVQARAGSGVAASGDNTDAAGPAAGPAPRKRSGDDAAD